LKVGEVVVGEVVGRSEAAIGVSSAAEIVGRSEAEMVGRLEAELVGRSEANLVGRSEAEIVVGGLMVPMIDGLKLSAMVGRSGDMAVGIGLAILVGTSEPITDGELDTKEVGSSDPEGVGWRLDVKRLPAVGAEERDILGVDVGSEDSTFVGLALGETLEFVDGETIGSADGAPEVGLAQGATLGVSLPSLNTTKFISPFSSSSAPERIMTLDVLSSCQRKFSSLNIMPVSCNWRRDCCVSPNSGLLGQNG
jgi:hypothetical protein